MARPPKAERTIRYGVVGLGWIAQAAVIPAFRHGRKRRYELVALFSGDREKRERLRAEYQVAAAYSYEELEAGLRESRVDALYIALPNHLHAEYTERAAKAGVHVLCEKPLAVTETECRRMIEACRAAGVKLMVSYRLHFEPANLRAIEIAQSGKIGDPKLFVSSFTFQVREGDIRTRSETGGGPLLDLGVYCVNASRNLFRAQPVEVQAMLADTGDPRFGEVEETAGALVRFPKGRLALFTCSFGNAPVSSYRIVGTKGDLRVDPAYDFERELRHFLTVGEKTRERTFARRDQFAPVLGYFADCIRENREPEPSGTEGWIDVAVLEAIRRSAREGKRIPLNLASEALPTPDQEADLSPPARPQWVGAPAPSVN